MEALEITTNELPGGEVGAEYDAQLECDGGVAPYHWSIAEGRLPQGLRLEDGGRLHGVPLAPLEAELLFRVHDSVNTCATYPVDVAFKDPFADVRVSEPAPLADLASLNGPEPAEPTDLEPPPQFPPEPEADLSGTEPEGSAFTPPAETEAAGGMAVEEATEAH